MRAKAKHSDTLESVDELAKKEREGETEIVYGLSVFIGATAYWHYSNSQGKDLETRVKQGACHQLSDSLACCLPLPMPSPMPTYRRPLAIVSTLSLQCRP